LGGEDFDNRLVNHFVQVGVGQPCHTHSSGHVGVWSYSSCKLVISAARWKAQGLFGSCRACCHWCVKCAFQLLLVNS
jgi:hypothetical protein